MLNGQKVEERTMTVEKLSQPVWLLLGACMLTVMVVIAGITALCRVAHHKLTHPFRAKPKPLRGI
jgi:hypothetical protein